MKYDTEQLHYGTTALRHFRPTTAIYRGIRVHVTRLLIAVVEFMVMAEGAMSEKGENHKI